MPPYIELDNMPSAATLPASRVRAGSEHGDTSRPVGDWAAFFGTLVGAGQLHIATPQPAVTLEHLGHWPGIRLEKSFGIASGRRFKLRIMLDRWSHLERSENDAADRDRRSNISILDRDGAAVLDLGFEKDRRGVASDILAQYAALCRTPSRSEPLSMRTEDTKEPNADPLRRLTAELGDSVGLADLAEATGLTLLSPARLRERGCCSAVDAALVPCFLEALAEQALPIRIDTGTAGVAHSLDGAFFYQRREGTWQTLKSGSARFRIDTSKIDSAWVVTVSEAIHEHSSLRLYDTRGRLLAKIGAVPGFVSIENPIWRTLINALAD